MTRIGNLHLASTTPTAQQPLQQSTALACGAATLAAWSHIRSQSLAGGEVLLPGHIPGMVLWQADRPLRERHLDGRRPDLARRVQTRLLGILYVPREVSVACGEVKIKIKGTVIASLNGIGNEATELESASGSLSGNETGKSAILQYYNDGGTKVVPQLLSSVSGGAFKESDEIVEGEPLFKTSSSQMFVITGR